MNRDIWVVSVSETGNTTAFSKKETAESWVEMQKSGGYSAVMQSFQVNEEASGIWAWVSLKVCELISENISDQKKDPEDCSWFVPTFVPIKSEDANEIESCQIEQMIDLYGKVCKVGAECELRTRLLANKSNEEEVQKICVKNKWSDVEQALIIYFEKQKQISQDDASVLTYARKVRNKIFHGEFPEATKLLLELGYDIKTNAAKKVSGRNLSVDCLETFLNFVCGGGLNSSRTLFFKGSKILSNLTLK